MDVHASNQLLYSSKECKVIHMFIPCDLLKYYGICVSNIIKVSIQTRFHSLRMHEEDVGKFINVNFLPVTPNWVHFNLDKSKNMPDTCGLCLSVPMRVYENGLYNPYNILIVKIKSLELLNEIQIPFYYITIIEGLRQGILRLNLINENGPKIETEKTTLAPPESFFKKQSANIKTNKDLKYLSELIDDIRREDTQKISSMSSDNILHISPNSMLSNIVTDDRYRGMVMKHHPALEAPSVVRGHEIKPIIKTIKKIDNVKVKISLNKARLYMLQSVTTRTRVSHTFSNEIFYIYVYSELEKLATPLRSMVDNINTSQLSAIHVFDVIKSEYDVLFKIADKVCESFSRELVTTGWKISQHIPVSLPIDYSSIYKKLEHVQEAFYIIKTKVNINASWIRAGLNLTQENKIGYWVDKHFLWESAQSEWGAFTKFANSSSQYYKGVANVDYIKEIFETIDATAWNCIQLVVIHDLNVLLILPGGFVIKGNLSLSKEELDFIKKRYGF